MPRSDFSRSQWRSSRPSTSARKRASLKLEVPRIGEFDFKRVIPAPREIGILIGDDTVLQIFGMMTGPIFDDLHGDAGIDTPRPATIDIGWIAIAEAVIA